MNSTLSICDLNINHDTLYTIQSWINPVESELYVLSTSSSLKKKEFETSTVKEVHFIDKMDLYRDDTIRTVRLKIASLFNINNPNDLYLFYYQSITNELKYYVISNFLTSVFRKKVNKIETIQINRLFKMVFSCKNDLDNDPKFPIPYKKNEELVDLQSAYKHIEKAYSSIQFIIKSLNFSLEDLNAHTVIFPFNPLRNNEFEFDDILDVNIESHNNLDLGSFQINSNRIMAISKQNLEVNDLKINEDFYFQNSINVKNDTQFNKITEYLQRIDNIKINTQNYMYNKYVPNITCESLNFRILVTPHRHLSNIQNRNNSSSSFVSNSLLYDVTKIFNLLHVTNDIPFIVLKAEKERFLCRVLNKQISKVVSDQEFKSWIQTEQQVLSKPLKNDINKLVMKLKYKEEFITVILKATGEYELIFPPRIKVNEIFTTFVTHFETVFLKQVNEILQVDNVIIHKPILNVNVQILEFTTINNLIFQNKLKSVKELKNQLSKNPFLQVIDQKTISDVIKLKYKRVSNFVDMNEVAMVINEHYSSLSKNEIIQILMHNFQYTEDEAITEFDMNVQQVIQVKPINSNNRVLYKRTSDHGIIIELKRLNDRELQIVLKNAHRIDYHLNTLQSIVFSITTTDTSLFNKKTLADVSKSNPESESEFNLRDVLNAKSNVIENNNEDNNEDNNSAQSFKSVSNSNSANSANSDYSIENVTQNQFDDISFQNDDGVDYANLNKTVVVQNTEPITTQSPKEFNDIEGDEDKLKSYHRRYILGSLQQADPNLFDYSIDTKNKQNKYKIYSRNCGAVDRKQPVVITEEEKQYIDKYHPNSYNGYVKTGSTTELKDKHYYICPIIWCPYGKTSITYDDFINKYDRKCPEPFKETAIILHDDKQTKRALGKYERYPQLMSETKHPQGLNMVCCGYKKTKDTIFNDDENKKNIEMLKNKPSKNIITDRYVKNEAYLPVEDDRYATLPPKLNAFFNRGKNDTFCVGLINNDTRGCFLRYGLSSSTSQKFLNAIRKTIDHQNEYVDSDQLIKHIIDNMTMFDFLFLNNGNTAKTFAQVDINITDEVCFQMFKKYFVSKSNALYVKLLNLERVCKKLENEYTPTRVKLNSMDLIIKREFILYWSMQHFIAYLHDQNIEKTHEYILDFLRFKWMNPNDLNYLILDVEDPLDIKLICPKYTNALLKHSNKGDHKEIVILLKNKNFYEQLHRVDEHSIKDRMKDKFSHHDKGVQQLINVFETNCTLRSDNNTYDHNEMFNILFNDLVIAKNNKTAIVINHSFKVIGLLLINLFVFIPLETSKEFNSILHETCLTNKHVSVIYIDRMYKMKHKESPVKTIKTNYETIYSNISKLLSNSNIHNKYKYTFEEDNQICLTNHSPKWSSFLNSNNTYTFPLNLTNMENDELYIFTNEIVEDERVKYFKKYMETENEYLDTLYEVKKELQKLENYKQYQQIYYLRHEMNPLSKQEKLTLMQKIIGDMKVLNKFKERISNEILVKGLMIINKSFYKTPQINDTVEVLFGLNDLNNGNIKKHYDNSVTPYPFIKSSIEDVYLPTKVLVKKSTSKIKHIEYLTGEFIELEPKYLWKQMGDYKPYQIKILNSDKQSLIQEENNKLLQIFRTYKTIVSNVTKSELQHKQQMINDLKVMLEFVYSSNPRTSKIKMIDWYLHTNPCTTFEKKTDISIQDYVKLYDDINYCWGIVELYVLAKQLDLVLIIIGGRNKVNDNKLKLCNSTEVFTTIRDVNEIQKQNFIIFNVSYPSKDTQKIKFHVVLEQVKELTYERVQQDIDCQYKSITSTWNDLPKLLKEEIMNIISKPISNRNNSEKQDVLFLNELINETLLTKSNTNIEQNTNDILLNENNKRISPENKNPLPKKTKKSNVIELRDPNDSLKQLQFKIKLVKGDGNCQYNAVKKALIPYKNIHSVEKIRKKVAKYIRENIDYENIVDLEEESEHDKNIYKDYDEFFSAIENNKWGDHLTLHAMSIIYKFCYYVHEPNTEDEWFRDDKEECNTNDYPKIYLYKTGELHYDYLKPN